MKVYIILMVNLEYITIPYCSNPIKSHLFLLTVNPFQSFSLMVKPNQMTEKVYVESTMLMGPVSELSGKLT